MIDFAIVENNTVVNVIVADTKEIAEQITGKEVIQTDGSPWIGWTRIDGIWQSPTPQEIEE